jgi:hypothetical protein
MVHAKLEPTPFAVVQRIAVSAVATTQFVAVNVDEARPVKVESVVV